MNIDYIEDLSYEEKIIFLKIFCVLIKMDNNIDNEEISFLKSIAQKYGIDSATTLSIIKNTSADYIIEAKHIVKRTHALELIKELCFLANIDDNLNDAELDVIIKVADIMGVDNEKLILINRFVLDNIILNKTGRIILEKENG